MAKKLTHPVPRWTTTSIGKIEQLKFAPLTLSSLFFFNKTKLIWIYDREKRQFKDTILQRKGPQMARQDHIRPYKAIQGHIWLHESISGHTWQFKDILFPCTLFVPFGTFFAHVSTPKRTRTTTRGQILQFWKEMLYIFRWMQNYRLC